MVRMYTAECYWPGVTEAKLREASARAAHAAEAVSHEGTLVQYLGSVLFPGDEVVLFEFGGASPRRSAAPASGRSSVWNGSSKPCGFTRKPALLPHGKEAPPMITSYEAASGIDVLTSTFPVPGFGVVPINAFVLHGPEPSWSTPDRSSSVRSS